MIPYVNRLLINLYQPELQQMTNIKQSQTKLLISSPNPMYVQKLSNINTDLSFNGSLYGNILVTTIMKFEMVALFHI